jgi:NAD(P)-dependent dehydrogenase (short-subunit alcohol dehydrogenase family)
MLASKFWGPFFASRSAAPLLRDGGSITFFSGLAADRPDSGTSIVSAVNAGLEGFARALAVELAPVRVNCVSPGVTDTAGWNFMPEDEREKLFTQLREKLPARRIGAPVDLAEAALAVMTNRYISGSVLHCDGGARLV